MLKRHGTNRDCKTLCGLSINQNRWIVLNKHITCKNCKRVKHG